MDTQRPPASPDRPLPGIKGSDNFQLTGKSYCDVF